jgi:molecular chaperone GrpE
MRTTDLEDARRTMSSQQGNEDRVQNSTPQTAETREPSGNGAEPAVANNELESMRAELDEATTKAEEYLDLLRRTRADFTNYRRRMEEERAQQIKSANLDLILKLLPILDDFERALASADPKELESGWAKGVQIIERNLRSLLASEDVHRIEAQGAQFDPREHEAVTHQPTTEAEEGTVVHVVRPGYRKGDRVVRPAQVVVARRP